ncbi:hypothetical protein BGZ82_007849 [Podila clonocystis]|nr:hypothetical protein BGZ82_007849 [Podila clonocystis]
MDSGQRLPDELLLKILDHFNRDQKTLKALLLVSRFFFMATIPLLCSSLPILDDSSGVQQQVQQESQDKVFELLIASVIHSQRHLASTPTSDTSDRAFSASHFLKRFGLQFIEPVTSSLLQDAIVGTSQTTIDYAQYWTRLPKSIYEHADQTLCALDLPIDEQETTPTYENIDVWDEHEEVDCLCNRYGVRQRLYLLLLQLYPEQATVVKFCVCKAHWYLHLADTLPNLTTLTLSRRQKYYLPETHLKNTISFITNNQVAFPGRRPLQIEFTSQWTDWMAPGAQNYISWYERRELDRQYQLPRTALYKAIVNPIEMDVSLCPDFYRDAGDDFAVDTLERLVDVNRDRFEFGESDDQEAFLARCKNLTSLEIYVNHDGSFSWAVDRNQKHGTSTLDQHPETPFSKLKELTLRLHKRYGEIEDAMSAVGRTVETICILDDGNYEDDDDGELEDLPALKIVGSWTLPCVRVIEISAYCSSMGDFSEPLLEVLKLWLYRAKVHGPLHDGDDSQDPIYVAPAFLLPCLTTLELHGMAALCFNYDTLDHVPKLESLHLDSSRLPGPVDSIQRLSHYNQHLQLPDSMINPPPIVGGQPWKDKWNLSKLQSLELKGAPSSVFCFSWLAGCPLLKALVLDTRNVTRRLPLLSSSRTSAILPDLSPNSLTHEYTFDEDLGSGSSLESKPLLYSKLESLSLRGNWVMSRESFARALAVYAPNLSYLQVERLNLVRPPADKPSWHGGWLIRAVYRAEEIMRSWRQDDPMVQGGGLETTPMSKSECALERKLLWVESSYRLIGDALDDLGLTQPPEHVLSGCQEAGKQVFSMCGQRYVRKEDVLLNRAGPMEE